jgi:chromosome segregation ATPase
MRECVQKTRDSLNEEFGPRLRFCEEENSKLEKRIEDEFVKKEDFDRIMQLFNQDLVRSTEETIAAVREDIAGIHEVLRSLEDSQDKQNVRVGQHQEAADALTVKTDKQGELLDALASRAKQDQKDLQKTFEASLSSIESRTNELFSRCNGQLQKVADDLVEGLRKERSRTHSELVDSLERSRVEVEPRFDSLERWRGVFEQKHTALDQRCASCEQRDTQQEKHLVAHDEDIRQLAGKCQDIPRHFEAQVNEVRAAAKDDLKATTLTALQGEMQLMAKVSQLSGQLPQQVSSGVPNYVFQGQSWQPHVGAQAPVLGQMILPGMPGTM